MPTPKQGLLAHIETLPDAEPREYVIPRDDDRDLKFVGRKLSREADSLDSPQVTSHTEVTIYVTKGGKIVTTVRRWRDTPEGKIISDKLTTGVHYSGESAVTWLKADNNKALGSLSKKAWIAAC